MTLVGPRSQFERSADEKNLLTLPELEPRILQPVA